MYNKEVRKV